MADNVTTQTTTLATIPGTTKIGTRDVTYSGDASTHIAPVGLVVFAGSDDAKTATDIDPRQGDVAHDAVDGTNPVGMGARAIAHGTNPTAVAAADRTVLYANRAGIQFSIGGHPNVITAAYNTTGAQTDDPVVAVVGSGAKIVVTRLSIALDEAATVGVAVRIGFGAANVPALGASGADGTAGILFSHPGVIAGGGFQIGDGSGMLGVGADGEDLRITCEAPTSGRLDVTVSYFTIES